MLASECPGHQELPALHCRLLIMYSWMPHISHTVPYCCPRTKVSCIDQQRGAFQNGPTFTCYISFGSSLWLVTALGNADEGVKESAIKPILPSGWALQSAGQMLSMYCVGESRIAVNPTSAKGYAETACHWDLV